MLAGGERDFSRSALHTVDPVIIHDRLAVQGNTRAVVAGEIKGVGARLRRVE